MSEKRVIPGFEPPAEKRWRATMADGSVLEAFDCEVNMVSGLLALWTTGTRTPTFEELKARYGGPPPLLVHTPDRPPNLMLTSLEWRKVEKL